MKTAAAFLLLLLFQQAPAIPKYNATGEWGLDTGTRFNLQLTGSTIKVQLSEGSNPRYLKYEVTLQNQEEVNTYKGSGYFVAKLQNGKECKFDTDWQFIVVNPDRIIGSASAITPDEDTCEVKSKTPAGLDMKRIK